MTVRKTKKIGVLALQGDFEAHQKMLDGIGVETYQVRQSSELNGLDGLIIPGGESTTLIKLLEAYNLIEPIKKFYADGKAIFGTCAGSILMAKTVSNSDQFRFGFIEATINRNGYGRQINSFEKDIEVLEIGKERIHAVFIRAPKIESVGKDVKILGSLDGDPVVAVQRRCLIATFHPEITDDNRIHRYFIEKLA